MINKVNRPTHLTLIKGAKASENDPGGSTGSGVFYEKHPGREDPSSKNPDSEKKKSGPDGNEDQDETPSAPHFVEQIGMTQVVKDLLENSQAQAEKNQGSRPGLAVKYQADGGTAKGLLLNKKV